MKSFRTVAALLLAAACALLIAACGGSDGTSSSSDSSGSTGSESTTSAGGAENLVVESGAKPASGSPVKVGMIAPSTGPIAYPAMQASAEGAVAGANERGGLGGHPIKLVFCDEAGDPNKALACARKLVSEGVVAAVSNESPAGELGIVEVLGKAKIPQIGTIAFATAQEDPYNYVWMNQTAGNAGSAQLAQDAGDSVSLVSLDIPISAAYNEFFEGAAKAAGQDFLGTTKVPLTTTDASPSAGTAIKGNPAAVILLGTSQIDTQVGLAAIQLGFTGKFTSVSNAFATDAIGNFKQAFPQWSAASIFPPVTETERFPEYETFMQDMALSPNGDAPTDFGYVQDSSIDAWLSVMALQKVANEAGATTTPAIVEALNAAKEVELGVTQPWSPSERGPGGISYPYVWATEFEGEGTSKLAQEEPLDVSATVTAGGIK
jgi:ABC-type branched-subunit amino acid transport system substrate-binding protein